MEPGISVRFVADPGKIKEKAGRKSKMTVGTYIDLPFRIPTILFLKTSSQ
jgi:hypothetical protein